ncbi:CHAP domain-containing protein [Nonomuraea sp. NPDC050643]|uniref:CHAP domain-containing protein n=1 Tax=Nonomuraea sp. NPDC050643 TaxID=3155660 RepID=UPI0033F6F4F3
MTPEMQKYIDLLESQLGYSEKADDYTKFGDWYGKNIEFDADYTNAPWCDMYLSWAAHKLGYEEWIGQFAWTVAHAEWFKEQGAWGKTPKVGAFVFYDWSGSNDIDRIDHVGIVTRVEGNTIHTIEGNIDGGVAKRKERDTSKVVGYGYPDRIKTRLDKEAAKKKAKEPIEIGEEALSSQIPRPGGDQGVVPLIAHPGESTAKQGQDRLQLETPGQGETPAKGRTKSESRPQDQTAKKADASSGTAKKVPQATASTAPSAPKKGKHAKPTTADTTAETAKPLPTHVDASAGGPLPSLDSPTLIGSALVAALALLAVAKTRAKSRRLRLATVTAGTPSRPVRAKPGHRRRRRATTAPVMAAQGGNAVELVESAERLATSAALRSLAASEAIQPTASMDAAMDAALSTSLSASLDASRPAAGRPGRPGQAGVPDSVRPVGGRRARHRRLPLETRPFDLATDAAPGRDSTGPVPHRQGGGASPYTPVFEVDPFEADFDRGRYEFTDETAPLAKIVDTGPLEVVLDTGPLRRVVDTGPFERIVIPGATSAFDAFAPAGGRRGGDGGRAGGDILDVSDISATYQGRRRRFTAEEHALLAAEPQLRGRRHRRSVSSVTARPGMEPYLHELTPRGRRHRGAPEMDGGLVGAGGRGGRHRA